MSDIMKLEKCALCGAEPETSIIHGRDDTWCGTRRCAMQGCETKEKWNRLQRAIAAKSKPAGRVLARGWWCKSCGRFLGQWRTRNLRDVMRCHGGDACVRVVIYRERKERGA